MAQSRGFAAETTALDIGFDNERVYGECEHRECRPIIPLKQTPAVKAGKANPSCERGTWTFAGSDPSRGASKWRCPTGVCKPGARWVKADRLHPSCRASRSDGSRSTEAVEQSNASSGA